MNMGALIKKRREELGLTQEELAQRIGYKSRSSITHIETSARLLPQPTILKIAKALEISVPELLELDEIRSSGNENITLKSVPILGQIACGTPILANQQEGESRFVAGNASVDFCLIAKGNSMIDANIEDGDIIFCHKQETVENGEIAAVLIDDGAEYAEATLKRVYYYPKQSRIILVAENPEVPALTFAGEQLKKVRILGKAVICQKQL